MKVGKVVSVPEGKWVKKKELTSGPNLVVKKVDDECILCDLVFIP